MASTPASDQKARRLSAAGMERAEGIGVMGPKGVAAGLSLTESETASDKSRHGSTLRDVLEGIMAARKKEHRGS
jgi:hypothetical protein